jgi:hypothetical protein
VQPRVEAAREPEAEGPGLPAWFWRVPGAKTSPEWVSEVPTTFGRNDVRASSTTVHGTIVFPPRRSRQRTSAGVTSSPSQGGGAGIGGRSKASTTRSTRPRSASAGSEVTMPATTGASKSANGVSAP